MDSIKITISLLAVRNTDKSILSSSYIKVYYDPVLIYTYYNDVRD